MRHFYGFFTGIAVTLALTVSVAYAFDSDLDLPKNHLKDDFIHEVNKLVNNYCRAYVGYGRRTLGQRCYNNEVMTGADGEYIYCSDLTVDCFSKQTLEAND